MFVIVLAIYEITATGKLLGNNSGHIVSRGDTWWIFVKDRPVDRILIQVRSDWQPFDESKSRAYIRHFILVCPSNIRKFKQRPPIKIIVNVFHLLIAKIDLKFSFFLSNFQVIHDRQLKHSTRLECISFI